MTTTQTRTIPTTTDAKCDYYGATTIGCGCQDAERRDGGSYTMPDGSRGCKHRSHRITQAKAQRQQADLARRAEANINRLFGRLKG
jgi:hypothetical protein